MCKKYFIKSAKMFKEGVQKMFKKMCELQQMYQIRYQSSKQISNVQDKVPMCKKFQESLPADRKKHIKLTVIQMVPLQCALNALTSRA